MLGVFARSGILAEEEDATDDGRGPKEVDWGDKDADEKSLVLDVLCNAGSFALIASANARDMYSTSGTGTAGCTVDDERDLPGVGMALGRRGFMGQMNLYVRLRETLVHARSMSTTTTTTLQNTTVVVHPLVLLSVADHHARSVSRTSHKRVIGALLGQDNGKIINVANSFGIPFEEDDKDSKSWFLDHNYVQEMYDMFRKVNGASMSRPRVAQALIPPSQGAANWLVSHRPQAARL